jgi:hypothetical protein
LRYCGQGGRYDNANGALINVIARGIPGTEMLAVRLEPQQARQVAAWTRKLGQQPPPQIAGDAWRGEWLYFGKGDCAFCFCAGRKLAATTMIESSK